ncbi:glycosyltransferase [Thermobrachium celere]|uniref:Putative teichuronic acid biosynthesis glycosyl transferase TuaC n=1 Tax=Thermobrachium celere DSM 8682 TaxID=941824 RepID=R7RNH0_9CLOT|nr:glycosyltransferase [Thermobrachium celere]CDF57737.1 Putative teichuronic acid biosynthesis glycosyl transferase TuaC [Thermobrachium celere DSM 8682]
MKVLVISHMYPSSFNRISGIFVHQQVKALINAGCEVKVVSPIPYAPYILTLINKKWKAYRDVPYKDSLENVDIYHPRYIEFPRGLFFDKSGRLMAIGIKKIVRDINKEFKFDIIHSHVALPDGYAGMIINQKYKVPHVVTIHGQDFQNTIYKSEKCKKQLFKVLDNVDYIITVSNKLKKIVEGESFYSKIVTINNGIDKEIIVNQFKPRQSDNKIKIVSVSNLKKTKGLQYNLYALERLVRKYKDVYYDIIGEGEYKSELKRLVDELGLVNNVRFLGKMDHSKVISILKNYDIFSLPSYKEGFGMVYLEAMAQGLPVIAVKGEGIEDVINNSINGFLVERENIDELEKVLEKLVLDTNLRISIGKKALETVKNNYTWEINSYKIIELYKQLLNKE